MMKRIGMALTLILGKSLAMAAPAAVQAATDGGGDGSPIGMLLAGLGAVVTMALRCR